MHHVSAARPCLVLLLLLWATSVGVAQTPRELAKASREAQSAFYDRKRERPDLTPGAFEVLRFDTGYQFTPKYRRSESEPELIQNPDFYCNHCVHEKRIAYVAGSRREKRLCQREEEQVLDWLGRNLKMETYVHIEDPKFNLVWALPGMGLKQLRNPFLKEELAELADIFPKISDKTTALSPHERAHLYLIRAHRLLRDFWWLAGADDDTISSKYPGHLLGPYLGMAGRQEIFVLPRMREYRTFLDWSLGAVTPAEGICWHHLQDRVMMMAMHGQGQSDVETQNFFFHRMMHNYLDAYRVYAFKLPAWVQMGIGHWVERREYAGADTFCFSEGTLPKVLTQSRWLPAIKKLVAKDRVKPFVETMSFVEYGDFPPEYHMVVYSQFCFLLSLGPAKFQDFINELKGKQDGESLYQAQVRGLKKAYGITALQFDTRWRAWVLAVYPDV